jgi:hypothetical protein
MVEEVKEGENPPGEQLEEINAGGEEDEKIPEEFQQEQEQLFFLHN